MQWIQNDFTENTPVFKMKVVIGYIFRVKWDYFWTGGRSWQNALCKSNTFYMFDTYFYGSTTKLNPRYNSDELHSYSFFLRRWQRKKKFPERRKWLKEIPELHLPTVVKANNKKEIGIFNWSWVLSSVRWSSVQ